MTRIVFVALFSIFATTLVSYAQTPSKNRLAKVEANWLAWAKKNRVSESQLALAYRGKIILNRAINVKLDKPMKLASLSKAITGACFLKLEKDGLFKHDTTLGELRGQGVLRSYSDTAADDRTMSQFLTHTSGLKPDITQGRIHNWFNRRSNRLEKIAKEALTSRNLNGKQGDFFYNNGNYAVLGAVIEDKSKKPYEEACAEALKDLDGFEDIKPSRLLKAISAFGGWEATAANYLKFANAAFGKDTEIQKNRLSLPHTKIDRGLYYGPGVLFRKNRVSGTNVWHFGALCFPDSSNDAGSYFAVIGSDWSVAVTHDVCLKGNAALDLDKTLIKAIFSKK